MKIYDALMRVGNALADSGITTGAKIQLERPALQALNREIRERTSHNLDAATWDLAPVRMQTDGGELYVEQTRSTKR